LKRQRTRDHLSGTNLEPRKIYIVFIFMRTKNSF
jgi:hypothetical protein